MFNSVYRDHLNAAVAGVFLILGIGMMTGCSSDEPAETTESDENRIIEFYDRNSGNLLLKFVASYVKNYGIFTVIGRRFKMIANAGQATGQNTRGSMF